MQAKASQNAEFTSQHEIHEDLRLSKTIKTIFKMIPFKTTLKIHLHAANTLIIPAVCFTFELLF